MKNAASVASGRAAVVCEPCRIRHRKCDFDNATCEQCRSNGIECIRQPLFKFRRDPKQKALDAQSPNLRHRLNQTHDHVEFFDETPGLSLFYTGDGNIPLDGEIQQISTISNGSQTASPDLGSVLDAYLSPTSVQTYTGRTDVSVSSYAQNVHPFSESEAQLIRNFAENMAAWTDVTDRESSFAIEVPRRALTDLLLRYAICAFSARHMYRHEDYGHGETQALDYQNRCLGLLIPAMSGGQSTSVSTLTAVAVLRQNEEMDEQDHRFHLEGASRIFNMAPEFTATGGLGEAAAWLCLREDIYISLTTQRPMNIRTDSFYSSASVLRGDDFAWTQKMVVGLAVLLNRTFGPEGSTEDIPASEAEIDAWDKLKPASFLPILFKPRSPKEGRWYPEICMLSPHHAVGVQYFHIAQIVLALARRSADKLYELATEGRARERRIRHHLFVVVGIAISNPKAENTWFTARHCLSVWSACLRKDQDQQAALGFLADMERRTGWKTAALMTSMRQQWADDSDED